MSAASPAPPRVSVMIPVYNEEESLATLHRELDAALASIAGGAEIVFVDDGSKDRSLAVLREIAAKDPRVRVVVLDGNHGQTAAFAAGFDAVRGEITVTLDADLQNDPADIPRLVAKMDAEGADVVNGVRMKRRDSWVRLVSSRVANRARNWVTNESVTDVGCSLRAMRTEYVKRVRLFRNMHRFLPTLLRMEGATKIVEMPVAHRERRYGVSKYGIGNRLWVGIVDLFGVRWMQARHFRVRVKN
ncbi:MAG: family 2 glycosyl transferase [Deltaproteobacteria bacterium]|nr:family 2 glycosyl transferase [Deltaproteobacteria bacterium]